MNNRYWHSGPVSVWAVLDQPPATLVNNAFAPTAWLSTTTLLGTCVQQPQVLKEFVREKVTNDMGGDLPIAEPLIGSKVQLKLELNRWDQVTVDRIQREFAGMRTTVTGVQDMLQASTMPDIVGNSCGILLYYTDIVNRPMQATFIPMATINSFSPVRIGNRTSAISLDFGSNTGFTILSQRWIKFDWVDYPNGYSAALDTALGNNFT